MFPRGVFPRDAGVPQEYKGNVGSRSMPISDAGASSDDAPTLDRASLATSEGLDTVRETGNVDIDDQRIWP